MRLGSALAALALLAGCGPAMRPRQAEFRVEGCAAAEVPAAEDWSWRADATPVITRGPAGAWDGVDALNPSVIEHDGVFYNLYSGYDGRAWHTGLATSRDGRTWEKFSGNPVLSPQRGGWDGEYIAANGSLLDDGSQFLYWYQGGRPPRIGLARSEDARRWQRHGAPVLEPGVENSWDEVGAADPYVIRCGSTYYMYYLGQNRRGVQRLGAARSEDGIHWQKFLENPILAPGPPGTFDERGMGEPAVFRAGGEFYMIYTGRSAAEERRLGLARSPDGVHWRRAALAAAIAGDQPWNSRVVCDPTIWAVRGKLWLWFGGGDVPAPAENLHGQIGFAVLESRDARGSGGIQ